MKDNKEFLNNYKYLKILVALNADELGIVVETNSETAFRLRPKVKHKTALLLKGWGERSVFLKHPSRAFLFKTLVFV